MRREAITLVAALSLGSMLLSACDEKPQTGTPGGTPGTTSAPPASPSATPSPPPPVAASATERKDGQPPIQGQVDPKSPPQSKDFERK